MSEPFMEPPDLYEICSYCGGEGSNEIHRPQHDDPYYCEVVKCEHCNGSGYVELAAIPTSNQTEQKP